MDAIVAAAHGESKPKSRRLRFVTELKTIRKIPFPHGKRQQRSGTSFVHAFPKG
jgi:hypothetical protein